ncbi:MAG TPA: hypothetical protein VGZ69_05815 [Candidatus Rhabdochlamydia sp.]|jgi:hypothetical protein|nr:hypothetical protein [Candidatus Rhabdochlamydia sp.]
MTINDKNFYYNAPDGYNLDTVIKKIKNSFTEGKKIALFIGRTHSEKLPQKEGFVWFSLDLRNPNPRKGEEENMSSHLQINFMDKERLSKIENFFDEVVVDRETYKFFDTTNISVEKNKKHYKFSEGFRDISIKLYHEETTKQLINLLRPGGEERLICDFAPRKELRAGSIILASKLQWNKQDREIVKYEHAWYKHLEKLEINEMLKEFFEKVFYVSGNPLPYPVTCTSGENTYFIAQKLL